MFWHTMEKKLLSIEQFSFVESSLKLKTKIIWELGHTIGIVGKPYVNKI